MSFKTVLTPTFKRKAKSLIKKYPSLATDLAELEKSLLENPKMGTDLGGNCYKIRFKISGKNTGKSGGARVITYLITKHEEIHLLTMYDKSEMESISLQSIRAIISEI